MLATILGILRRYQYPLARSVPDNESSPLAYQPQTPGISVTNDSSAQEARR